MKRLLRILYWRYKDFFHELMVEDFYGGIPQDISTQAFSITSERRQKLEKWLYYQVFSLTRRIPNNQKNVDMIFGMLLQLRLLLIMIGTEPEKKDTTQKKKEETDTVLKDALDGVDKFLKGNK